jgi:phospholipase C
VNNYNPAYIANGTQDPTNNGPFTIPPVSQPHIGDVMNAGKISWSYFGENWTYYAQGPGMSFFDPKLNPLGYLYCSICNPFQYATDIMTSPSQREQHINDTEALYNAISEGTLPAVSIVKPSTFNDGHPASSKVDLFESFCEKIVTQVQANKDLWKETAIFITFDEGGGFWDSGYVQPVDFFGDGTRIPLLVVSPYATGGKVIHSYADHVSIDKFIERNWKLTTISAKTRDNFPNPTTTKTNPYVPTNSPALDDLFSFFDFKGS